MPKQDMNRMTTGQVAQRAKKAGVQNVEGMNKQQMIQAMGGKQPAGRANGHKPAPQGTKPSDWKNVPGNQS